MVILYLILQYIPQFLIIGLIYVVGAIADIRNKLPNALQLLYNNLRLLFLCKVFK